MPLVGPEIPDGLKKRKLPADDYPRDTSRASICKHKHHVIDPSRLETKSAATADLSSYEASSSPSSVSHSDNSGLKTRIKDDHLALGKPSGADEFFTDEYKSTSRRVLGPMPQSASCTYNLNSGPTSLETSSDSEDDYGPSLPPEIKDAGERISNSNSSGSGSQVTNFEEVSHQQNHDSSQNSQNNKLQRADWMLAPPTSADWTNRIDPTKLKNRKFATRKSAQCNGAGKMVVSSIWTETPEQKRQRLEDEVLGRKEVAISSTHSCNMAQDSLEDPETAATAARVRKFNEKNRNRSLIEERVAAQGRGELEKVDDDDPSKRVFDREKDMALRGQLGSAQKIQLLNRAADFQSRFKKGKYL